MFNQQKQNFAFVVDAKRKQLNPTHPQRARYLQESGQASVLRQYPYTLILHRSIENPQCKPLILKLDPGSKVTGLALLDGNKVIWGMELEHRGHQIHEAMQSRAAQRRSRRNRHTQYREARFNNRKREEGWLAPSLRHRVETTMTWIKRICRWAPVAEIWIESVRFDTQAMLNPEISGVEYQQGELAGYEVREYLLEKWKRQCSYCGAKDVPLQVEHIRPKSKSGSNRVSNLALACEPCNLAKGNSDIRDFLSGKPDLLKRIETQARQPLRDAAAVNTTRWALVNKAKELGLPIILGTGGQTKFHRTRQNLPKQHWVDAACVGKECPDLVFATTQPLKVRCTGWGTRQMCGTNKYGFPVRHRSRKQVHFGFRTGDITRAIVTTGKKQGGYTGRVLCRASGSFDISTPSGRVAGLHYRFFKTLHKKDGYAYGF